MQQIPTTEYISITPQMAREWLKTNTSNRNLSEAVVDAYANDMRAGAWKLTHQGIGFDALGNLLDGQHRLHAIIKVNFPVVMAVTRGLAASARDVVDAQKPRTVADQLALVDGVPSANKYAGACRAILEIDQGRQIYKYTLNDVRTVLARYKDGITDVRKLLSGTEYDSVTIVGPLTYTLAADRSKMLKFVGQIRDGEGIRKTDPSYQAREYVRRGGRLDRKETIGVMLRTSYAYLHNEAIEHLKPVLFADPGSPIMTKVIEFFRVANRT